MKNDEAIKKLLDEEKVEFIHQASKEYLLHTIDSIKSSNTKATLILGFTLSVMAFAIPAILNQNNSYGLKTEIFLIFIIAIYTVVSFYVIRTAIFPISYAVSGNEPDNLIKQEVLKNDIMQIKLSEMNDYQERINLNIEISNKLNKVISSIRLSENQSIALFFHHY